MELRSSLMLLMVTVCTILLVSYAVRAAPIPDIFPTAAVEIPAEVATLVPTDTPDIDAAVKARFGLKS